MTGISPGRRPEKRRRSGTPGTACPSGPTIYGLPSSCGSHGAGSVPSVASAPGPRWWTMWSPTVGTGPGSSTGPISRACVSAAMIVKRRWNRRKNGGKRQGVKDHTGGRLGRVCVWARCVPVRPRQACGLPAPPPGLEKFQDQVCKTVWPPSCGIFSPREN